MINCSKQSKRVNTENDTIEVVTFAFNLMKHNIDRGQQTSKFIKFSVNKPEKLTSLILQK